MCRAAEQQLGPVDVLVNNAGISSRRAITRMTDDDWFESLAVNLTGSMYMIRELVPGMKARGWGRIVNVTSGAGTHGIAGFSAYAAAKGGVVALALTLAVELERFGIRVNALAPAALTDMLRQLPPELLDPMIEAGLPTVEECADAALGLVVDDAPNGQIVHVGAVLMSELPLAGVRVLELGYGIAAPVAARNLAQFGADVVRVESLRRPDSLRLGGAGWLPRTFDASVRRDTLPALNFSSAEKRSIGLEIDSEQGRAVFDRMVAAVDVVITNMSERALTELRLRYDDLRVVKPDLVHVTLPAFGSEGPYRMYRTWGHNLSAASGVDSLIGWPDRDPVQIGFAYPDFVSAQAATVAVLAALRRRKATGQGAHLELWQYAMTLSCLGPAIVAAQVSGHGAVGARQPRCRLRTPGRLPRTRTRTVGGTLRRRMTRRGMPCAACPASSISATTPGSQSCARSVRPPRCAR